MTSGRGETPPGPERPPQRERVVLARRRGARVVRTRVEVHEKTEVDDALVRGLMRAQLGLALRPGLSVTAIIALVPLLGIVFPALGEYAVFGIRASWLVLEVLVYPLLYLFGRLYVHLAEQAERDFMGVVDEDAGAAPRSTTDVGDDPDRVRSRRGGTGDHRHRCLRWALRAYHF